MKKNYLHIFIISFLIFSVKFSHAQTFVGEISFEDEDQKQLLIYNNGKETVGKILSIKNTTVDFLEKNKSESYTIQLFELHKIIVIDKEFNTENQDDIQKIKNTKIDYPHPPDPEVQGNNHLFYAETGFNLKAGKSEYRTIWGVVHNFDYGVSDGFTVGLGYILEGHFTGHLKFNYITKSLHSKFRAGFDFKFAAKPERFFDDSENRNKLGWEGYFQMSPYFSYGTPNRNVHISINILPLFERDDFFEGGLISFSFGGMVKLAPQWKLIYENTFGVLESNVSSFGFFSGIGINWFNEKNSIKAGIHPSPNFGFFNIPITELNTTASLPFISYSRYF